jgi:hypothetical protein
MSRGPGRVQRALLTLVTAPQAAATLVSDEMSPGPAGVPLSAVYYEVWETTEPTRAQKESVRRAIAMLWHKGQVDLYSRRECPRDRKAAEFAGWDEERQKLGCCGWPHIPVTFVGRPRTEEEKAASNTRFQKAMALLKRLGG